MATGGVFTLISNDGKQDRMLMATQLLNKRLEEVRCQREARGERDTTPTLNDIEKTHILFMYAHFKPFAAIGFEYDKVQPEGGLFDFGQKLRFNLPQFGDFFHDIAFHIRIGATTAVVNGFADNSLNGKFRYCDFVGHRLLKKVEFTVNGNPLDEYDSEIIHNYYSFHVPKDKEAGWFRCVGQEIPDVGYLPDAVRDIRQYNWYGSGPQTLKTNHDAVDMWIPLLFWFNLDPRLAVPSVAIPWGQRFIDITLENMNNIIFGDPFIAPAIETAELYINNIFVNPEVHDIFIKRIGFNLIRVYRTEKVQLNESTNQILLNQLKWPTETIYVSIVPRENRPTADKWWRNHVAEDLDVCQPWYLEAPIGPPFKQLVSRTSTYTRCIEMFSTITITASGIKLYDENPHNFHADYIPFTFGQGNVIRTPDDCGKLMIPFNLYPGSYQPSGHINISRVREFYFEYVANTLPRAVGARTAGSSTINNTFPADLQLIAIALNFLLISDGSAVLRYST